ncbi:Sphingomyelin phosphodiesterase [Paragonimus heterotremus]|uniref:Sphingomyelin phosphodiesterase n=1 Tax=Paragonimus heterotremus TaxID=100268 RepID=A0A8J4TT51_9TREM|nr:Sphingomyelin phosphodiesterase [Paragonimus heterotremus]
MKSIYWALLIFQFGIVCYLAQSNGDIGTFWHLTDFHVNLSYKVENDSGLWGNYSQDAGPLVAFSAIQHVSDIVFDSDKPDFILWGGDAASHQNVSLENVTESLNYLSEQFRKAYGLKNLTLIPVVGNHDVFPVNEMSPITEDYDRYWWCERLATDGKLWKKWIEFAKESVNSIPNLPKPDFDKFCYQSWLLGTEPPVLVLAVNSLVWYTNNPLVNESIEDPLSQFKWARGKHVKVFITMHVPVGVPEFSPNNYRHLKPKYNQELVTILRGYSDVIITTLASHQHIDTFRVVLNERYHPVGTIFLGPSVDHFHLDGIGSTNPRIRQYTYNRKAGKVMDYTQYMLDLSQEGPQWKLEYRAKETYKLQNLNATELANLLDEVTENDDPNNKWTEYWYHQLGGRPHDKTKISPNGECPEAKSVCRCQQICSIRHVDKKGVDACLKVCSESEKPQLDTIAELEEKAKGGSSVARLSKGATFGLVLSVLMALW